jgi:hypothetical protein
VVRGLFWVLRIWWWAEQTSDPDFREQTFQGARRHTINNRIIKMDRMPEDKQNSGENENKEERWGWK